MWFEIQETHWFALALILLIAELATGTTYLLWPAVAAGIAGLATLMTPISTPQQIVLFAAATIALTLLGRPLARRRLLFGAPSVVLNERDVTLLGQHGVAQAAFENGVGSVKLGDSVWRAEAETPIEAGRAVEVIAVDGATVRVRPLDT